MGSLDTSQNQNGISIHFSCQNPAPPLPEVSRRMDHATSGPNFRQTLYTQKLVAAAVLTGADSVESSSMSVMLERDSIDKI